MSLLQLKNVEKRLRRQQVLKGIDLTVEEGENLIIIGRSGGGKSVLLRHIMGLFHPDAGEVWFDGQEVSRMSEEDLAPVRKHMGMLFQNSALFDSMTVGENIAFPLREEREFSEATIRDKVANALKLVDLPGQEAKMPAELSGGMRKRVALARATVSQPRLMLYDEPTTGLDPIVADSINKLILRLGEALNMTAIVVTHDMNSAYDVGDRIAMLHEGKIYCVKTPEEIQASEDPVIHRFVRGISKDLDLSVI
jgi:phospholipid/cholesterol/gamma-HCH transport system ATP-binding protein